MNTSATQSNKPAVYNLNVYPTYAVISKQKIKGKGSLTTRQLNNVENLTENEHEGCLSYKAQRRLNNSVNWLVASAKNKTVFDKTSGQSYNFKINFLTFTLPGHEQEVTDAFFKNTLLRSWINMAKYKFGMSNFVWKVETQKNGNIHAHLSTDVFIHYNDLRNTWNKILRNNGVLSSYTAKHRSLSEDAYIKIYQTENNIDTQTLRKRYAFGLSTSWESPNTTDVHAVHKIKDIGAYLAKYMAKNDEDRRLIKGRLWSCSYSLSASNKLCIEMAGGVDTDIFNSLCHPSIKYKVITAVSKLTGQLFTVGEIFFFKLSDWGKIIKGRILDFYCDHRDKIRHDRNQNEYKECYFNTYALAEFN